jgi:hypothetical protein
MKVNVSGNILLEIPLSSLAGVRKGSKLCFHLSSEVVDRTLSKMVCPRSIVCPKNFLLCAEEFDMPVRVITTEDGEQDVPELLFCWGKPISIHFLRSNQDGAWAALGIFGGQRSTRLLEKRRSGVRSDHK